MFKKWRKKRAAKKEKAEKIKNDAYLTRLQNSAKGYCGCKHEGEGPFLSIEEINFLMWRELERRKAQ